ncbi:MAG TPA: CBS domain-containing protein [Anaerolineales bacterium]|nr:CBS domain-containing protein [Anaerolineales bacterium]
MLTTVKQVLDSKGHQVWSVAPDDTVFNALKLMAEKNVGALLVLEEGKLIGIISERDYARKVVLEGKSSMDTPVEEIMTPRVLYVRTNQSIEECMAIMTDRHIRHLPVLEDSELVGVISIGDVVKAVISHQEFVIEQLENYIAGR